MIFWIIVFFVGGTLLRIAGEKSNLSFPGIQMDKSTQLHSHSISRLGSYNSLLAYIFSHYQKE